MEFRSIINIPKADFEITYNDNCLFVGSCFAENIGCKLLKTKIPTSINPTGILYNPLSIIKSINNALTALPISENELFFANGIWNHYDFHSKYSNSSKSNCLNNINDSIKSFGNILKNASIMFVTMGTAYVYKLAETQNIVCNCHKQPANIFSKQLISVSEIVEKWESCIEEIRKTNPNIKIVFTVSPIRHIKDGAHNNQISKATLILAENEIVNNTTNTFYFPAYEIMNDELRDYRFYAADFQHPSEIAENYIWERFCKTYFNENTMTTFADIQKIVTAAEHRPFNPQTKEHKDFCLKNLKKIEDIKKKFHNINFEEEEQKFSLYINDNPS